MLLHRMKFVLLQQELKGIKKYFLFFFWIFETNFVHYIIDFKFIFRMERSFNQTLRAQQDEAYELSLRADQEKERARLAERKKVEELELMKRRVEEEEERRKEVNFFFFFFRKI